MNAGVRFMFLPIRLAAFFGQAVRRSLFSQENGRGEIAMLTALIVEDELLVRLGILSCVPWSDLDIAVVGEAADGLEAWELYQKYRPDIILLDVLIPRLDGVELLRRIRSADQRCAVIIITGVDQARILNEIRQLGVSSILEKRTVKRDDLRVAVQKVCESLRSVPYGTSSEEIAEKKAWEQFLFEIGSGSAPFEAQGITGLRFSAGDRMTHALQNSLSSLILQRLGRPESYVLVSRRDCQLLIWKEKITERLSETILADFIRYIQENLHIRLSIVSIFEALPGDRMPHMARRFVSLLQDRRLFDDPVLLLDANGNYRDRRLEALRNTLAMNLPICTDKKEIMSLKARLDRYPGMLENGFETVLGNAVPLLHELELSDSQPGLWEMTGRICIKAEERINQVIRKVRPEILKVMGYIQAHLSEELTREKLSRLVSYDSAYLSKLFRAETGLSYIDYLFQSRMLRAREMLLETDDRISEISARCGFSDFSYFCARFRQFYGMTPREWRERNRETEKGF